MGMRFRLKWFFPMLIVAVVSGVAAAPARSQSIALITDVAGPVTGAAPVTILSEITADTRLQLGAGARLVAIYLKSGDEYTFRGPAQVHFAAGEPRMIQGARPVRNANPLGKGGNVTIKPVGVTQAAYVMRSGRSTARIKLLTLSGTKTLDTSPEFRWRGFGQGVKYRVELTDDTGRSLFEAEVEDTAIRLPETIALREGASYSWEVSTRAADNRRYVTGGDFSVASAELRAEAEALRPPADSPVSQRVAFAAWLEQVALRDEARRYWRELSAERPDDEKLKALAAE